MRANDTPLHDLYLILHKVRGFPSYDIAERIEFGTQTDPGPWWSIPTSGHRAYPLRYWPLEDMADISDCPHKIPVDFVVYDEVADNDEWSRLRDHYTIIKEEPRYAKGLTGFATSLVERLGLTKPVEFKRRKL